MSQSHKSYPKKRQSSNHARHGAGEPYPTPGTPSRDKRAFWLGFFVCAIGYFFLSFQQPAGWGQLLWAFLAFGLVPGIAGAVIWFTQGSRTELRSTFMRGLKAVGCAMFLYTGVTLMVLASRVGRPDGGAQVALVWFLVTGTYTLLAGCVAGCVNMLLSRIAALRDNHGSAS